MPFPSVSSPPYVLSDALRNGWMPTGAIAETVPRWLVGNNLAITSGTLQLGGGMVLPAGRPVSSISVVSGGQAGASMTHQWFALFSASTRAKLAITADDTSTAWAADTKKTLTLAANYTPAVDIAVYVGVLVTGSTVPFLLRASTSSSDLWSLAPATGGLSTTGLTTTASCPDPAATPSGAYPLYAYVS